MNLHTAKGLYVPYHIIYCPVYFASVPRVCLAPQLGCNVFVSPGSNSYTSNHFTSNQDFGCLPVPGTLNIDGSTCP